LSVCAKWNPSLVGQNIKLLIVDEVIDCLSAKWNPSLVGQNIKLLIVDEVKLIVCLCKMEPFACWSEHQTADCR
jgi:hypothetical protein